jgi:hypothetical protein
VNQRQLSYAQLIFALHTLLRLHNADLMHFAASLSHLFKIIIFDLEDLPPMSDFFGIACRTGAAADSRDLTFKARIDFAINCGIFFFACLSRADATGVTSIYASSR